MTASGRLTIVQINDTHGYVEPHPELVWTPSGPSFPTMGGYARIASLLAQFRRANPDGVLAVDNGDTFHGTFPAVTTRGEGLIPLLNALKLDAMTAHWDFAWGPRHFEQLAARLDYPMLAINCYEIDSGERPFPASVTVERAGVRIGIIGIAATIIDKSMPKQFSEGLRFASGFDELPDEIARLRKEEKADLVVVLSHLGFPQDVLLANTVQGIDVLLSGHTHNRLETPVMAGGAMIIQSGCHGSFIGHLELEIADGRVAAVSHSLIPVDAAISPDAAMETQVDRLMAPYRKMLDEVVGQTAIGLHRNNNLFAPMDDVLLAAISATASTDIAFSNGWRYGAPIAPGPVRMNDLWNIIPTDPPVSTTSVSGAEITVMMEENLERTFSANPLGQMGGYLKRFRGLTIYGKIENPSGHRIERIFAGKEELDPLSEYKVAFVTEQGVPLKYGRDRRQLPVHAIDSLRTVFNAGGQLNAHTLGRFIPV